MTPPARNLTPKRYERLRNLFEIVCDLPETERALVLDRFCATDPELRAMVEGLLVHDPGGMSRGGECAV